MEKMGFFKRKEITATFSAFAFLAGFLLLDTGSFTGNVVLTDPRPFSPIALLGLLLILCSAILAFYTLRKK